MAGVLTGSFSTNNVINENGVDDLRHYEVKWTATQSVLKNQSYITWSIDAVGGTSNYYQEWLVELKINDTVVYTKTDAVKRYKGQVAVSSAPYTIDHDNEGNANFNISLKVNTYWQASWNKPLTGTKTYILQNIPRSSSLKVSNGVLGTSQTLTVTKQASTYTHTITATCGNYTSTICTKSSNTSFSFTPSLTWANTNTSGTNVSVVYKIVTYNGTSVIGEESYTVSCTIPSNIVPSCSISVADPIGDFAGNTYVKGMSKFQISVTGITAYGSPIASYKISANGANYTTANVTTDLIKNAGANVITATVTDKRGRVSAQQSVTINVLDYQPPVITNLIVRRCNSNGTENDQGEYVHVTFGYSITDLQSTNQAVVSLQYKKTSESVYTNINGITSETTEAIFQADSGSSFDVLLTVTDNYKTVTKSTSASTARTIMHFAADGVGIAFGKVSEKPCMEIAMDVECKRVTTFNGADLDTLAAKVANMPTIRFTFGEPDDNIGKDGDIYIQIFDPQAFE